MNGTRWTQTFVLDWNATIQPGASVSIGFNGSHTGTNPRPAEFTLNGAACA